MDEKKICRLCLNVIVPFSHAISTDSRIKEMLVTIFPQMNINLTQTISICEDCFSNLSFTLRVKKSYLTKIEAEHEKIIHNIPHCQICFETESDFKPLLHKMNHSEIVLRHCLKIALPEHRKLNLDIIVCALCWSWMKTICSFKNRCIKIEEYLNWYSQRQDNKILSNNDIENILQEQYQRFIATHFGYDSIRMEEIRVDTKKYIEFNTNKNHISSGTKSDNGIFTNHSPRFHKKYFAAKGEIFSNIQTKNLEDPSNCPSVLPDNNVIHEIDDKFDEFIEKGKKDDDVIIIKDDSSSELTHLSDTLTYNLNNGNNLIRSSEKGSETTNNSHDNNQIVLYCESSEFTELARNIRKEHDVNMLADKGTIKSPLHTSNQFALKTPVKESLAPTLLDEEETFTDEIIKEEPCLMPTYFSPTCDIYDESNNRVIINEPNEVRYDEEESLSIPDENCDEMVNERNNVIDLTNVEEYYDERLCSQTERKMKGYKGTCWACYRCKAMFHKKTAIRQHLLNHDDPWYKYGRFKCNFCSFRANWKGSVTRHQIFHKKEKDELFLSATLTYLCPYCDITFFKKEKVEFHVSEHITSWNTFQCLECMFSTNVGKTLTRHYRIHQKRDPNFLPYKKKEELFSDYSDFGKK